jgi:SAM-dependent methyltransferase
MPGDREAVRDAAKYLRSVRPIDPAEITEYVPGGADLRLVRQILRESALDLGLAEGPDGSFRPAATGPFRPDVGPVEGLPDQYDRALTDLLVERYGPEWHRGETGAAIRDRIDRLKADYFEGRSVRYDRDVALAYAVYHLADYYATGCSILEWLAAEGLLPSRARVLDVGAGVGGPALALADCYDVGDDADERPLLEYHAVEPSAAAEVLAALLGDGPRNVHTTIHRERAEDFDPIGEFDLVFFNNVLSELSAPEAVAARYLESVAEDGSLVLTAPADRETSLTLRSVERGLESRGATVYGPTVRLWPNETPTDDCWSFDRRPDIDAPSVQTALATEAEDPDAVCKTSVQYSYAVMRRDARRRYDLTLDRSNVAMLAETESHVGSRLDLVVAKLSRDLSGDGHPLFRVSDGSESLSHFAVLVNETALNEALLQADYGDLLQIEGALALHNAEEGAYNLVVDEETVVDRA